MDQEKKYALTLAQAVMFYMVTVIAVNIISVRLNSVITGSDVIGDTVTYGSKVLIVTLPLVSLLFERFTPMRLNPDACRFRSTEQKEPMKVSILICIGLVIAMELFRFVMQGKNPLYREIPYFGLYLNMNMRWFYPINIVLQEIFIKAFVQDNISRAFDRRHPVLTALVTSLLFMTLHVQYPFYYMMGAFTLCFVTGLIYEKWPSIWGPVLIHLTLGFLPRSLGVMQIIDHMRGKGL